MKAEEHHQPQLMAKLNAFWRRLAQFSTGKNSSNPTHPSETFDSAAMLALRAAIAAVASAQSAETVLQQLAEQILYALNVTCTVIAGWDAATDTATVLAKFTAPNATPAEKSGARGAVYPRPGLFKPSLDNPDAGQIHQLQPDDPTLPESTRTQLAQHGVQAALIVPFITHAQITGFAELWDSRGPRDFSQAEMALAQAMTQLGAVALDRAKLAFAVAESEAKYSTLVEQSSDAIYLIQTNKFVLINHRFEELFGVTKAAISAPDFAFSNIVAPKSKHMMAKQMDQEQFNAGPAEAGKISPVYEFTALDKHGREIEVELTVSYPTYKGKIATQGVLRDISERKKIQAEQADLQAQMFQSAKLASVGELAAGVAHEINNPIFGIREYADLMLEDTPANHPNYDILTIIIREANRIADTVRHLLEFARPADSQFMPVYLADVWQLVFNLMGQTLAKHAIQLEVDIPPDLPPLRARTQHLQQVLLNLVSNSRDALNEKYPDGAHTNKRMSLCAGVGNGGQVVWFTVRDEGTGIAPELHDFLFNPFFTTKRGRGGTGLGLSISHKIIEKHHGKMELRTEPGQFTEFKITLPVWRNKEPGDRST